MNGNAAVHLGWQIFFLFLVYGLLPSRFHLLFFTLGKKLPPAVNLCTIIAVMFQYDGFLSIKLLRSA